MAVRQVPITIAGALFCLALLSSAIVFATTILPMLDGRHWPDHQGHLALVLVHVAGGIGMITFGATALYVGWTRRAFRWHRWLGYSYLFFGSLAAILVFIMAAAAPHDPRSLYVATGTLSLVWLSVAAMGWRAARNRRFASHRQWMIRSYVLSWTFVGCRLASMVDFYPWLGAEGITAAIWVNWIVPLVVCEIVLHWKEGAKA